MPGASASACVASSVHQTAQQLLLWGTRALSSLSSALQRCPLLLPPTASASLSSSVLVFLTVITALRASKSWCFGNGVYLRQRVLLLSHVRAWVLRWEAQCLAEVAEYSVDVDQQARSELSRLMPRAQAEQMLQSWADYARPPATTASFYGIAPSVALSADLPLEEMLEVAYLAHHLLHLREDRVWLRRLDALLQHVVLYRLSLMQEVRLYARLHRRVLFPRGGRRGTRSTAAEQAKRRSGFWFAARAHTPLLPWRLHRRPTWLASVSAGGVQHAYLCLPLSYFPVEAVLPYTAAESWLSDRLLGGLVPVWEAEARRLLSDAAMIRQTENAVDVGREVAFSKIRYLFVHYTAPLLRAQIDLHRRAARRFCLAQLEEAAGYDSLHAGQPSCAAGSTSAGRPKPRWARWSGGSLRLLAQCARDAVSVGQSASERSRASPPSAVGTAPLMARAVRRALLLRAASQGLSVLLQVCLPRLSLRHVTEVVAAGYFLRPSADLTASAAVSSPVEALLQSLAQQMLWTAAAGVAELYLQRLLSAVTGDLAGVLSRRITAALEEGLLTVDEAFLARWLRGAAVGVDVPGHPSSPPPQELRAGAGGSYAVRRTATAEEVLRCGQRGGEKVLAVHDAVVKRALRCAALAARTAVTRDWRTLLGAVVSSWVDVPQLTTAVSVSVGYSMPPDVSRLLGRRDESLPTQSPAGLRLLLEVVAEETASLSALECLRGADGVRGGRRRATVSHPYLALVACARVWSFEYLLPSARREAEEVLRLVREVRQLHSAVASYHYGIASAAAADTVAALQEDARCIAHYSLHQAEQAIVARCGVGAVADGGGGHVLHRLLDAEETRLLQTPSALGYLPAHVDYFDLFSLPYRFVLRQLGLEVVFAYRAASGMEQESRQMAEEWWTQALFNSAFNPLTCVLQEAAQLVATTATVMLLCTHLDIEGWPVLVPTTLARFFAASHTIESYREVLRGGVALRRLEEGVTAVQQLCECLPRHIASEMTWARAAVDTCSLDGEEDRWEGIEGGEGQPSFAVPPAPAAAFSQLQERRRLWRRYLASRRPELVFDRDDRIVSGLQLREAVGWQHVYFAYPQLYADGSWDGRGGAPAVRPALADVSLRCPAVGMTAVIGPSGAGKSSMGLLLRRLYDPVPVVEQCRGASPMALAEAGLFDPSHELLAEVLRLALVENALPLPAAGTAKETASLPLATGSGEDSKGASASVVRSVAYSLQIQPGYLTLDGIPLCLFSSAYVRQWLAWLPQSPQLFPDLTFLQSIRATSPFVTLADAQHAVAVCGCDDFITDKHRTLHDRAGPLSGGEGQRLALARVIAKVLARRRCEVLHGGGEQWPGGAAGGIVLDEPTSRLDAASELRLIASLTALTSAQSPAGAETEAGAGGGPPELPLFMWTVSHRMSTLQTARCMVVVEHGRVTATGCPADVLARNSFAQAQWQLQRLKGSEKEVADGSVHP